MQAGASENSLAKSARLQETLNVFIGSVVDCDSNLTLSQRYVHETHIEELCGWL